MLGACGLVLTSSWSALVLNQMQECHLKINVAYKCNYSIVLMRQVYKFASEKTSNRATLLHTNTTGSPSNLIRLIYGVFICF